MHFSRLQSQAGASIYFSSADTLVGGAVLVGIYFRVLASGLLNHSLSNRNIRSAQYMRHLCSAQTGRIIFKSHDLPGIVDVKSP